MELKPVFKADQTAAQTTKGMKDQAQSAAAQLIGHNVHVEMMDGQSHEGRIVNVDDKHLYLEISDARGFFPLLGGGFGSNFIIPLVLYELLVISLLY